MQKQNFSKTAVKNAQFYGLNLYEINFILYHGKRSKASKGGYLYSAVGRNFDKLDHLKGTHLFYDPKSSTVISIFKNKNFKIKN